MPAQPQPQTPNRVLVSDQLERNILHWIVVEMEPFRSIEAPTFQKIFYDLPGVELPFTSATTVKRRLVAQLEGSRKPLNKSLMKLARQLVYP